MANGLFKGNATYFGRKSGTLEDIVAKINEAPSKPEVFDMKSESEAYKKVFNAAMKKFGVNSPADFKSDEEKKKFFDYVDKNYKGKNEAMDDKAADMNKKLKSINKDLHKKKIGLSLIKIESTKQQSGL